jgi:hypothetical protein
MVSPIRVLMAFEAMEEVTKSELVALSRILSQHSYHFRKRKLVV